MNFASNPSTVWRLLGGPLAAAALLVGAGCTSHPEVRLQPPPGVRLPFVVDGLKGGRIRISTDRQGRIVDLAGQISGCKSELFDHTTGERVEAEVGLEIVDVTQQAPNTYLVLLATASSNCNVQGECGAGPGDATLLWLKLANDLAIVARQAVVLEHCRFGVEIEADQLPDSAHMDPVQARDLPWVGDLLEIRYGAVSGDRYDEVSGDQRAWRLTYDRRDPDAGLKTERLAPK